MLYIYIYYGLDSMDSNRKQNSTETNRASSQILILYD